MLGSPAVKGDRVLARPAAGLGIIPAVKVVLKAGGGVKELAGEAEGMFMDCERATLFSGPLVPSGGRGLPRLNR